MKILKLTCAALAFAGALAGAAAAQQTQQKQPEGGGKLTMSALMKAGFNIVDMQYLSNSIVFVLQRHDVGYICDANLNGETKICVRLK